MSLRDDNAARSRAAILTASRREFETHGFEAASMRRIADGAGVATGTLFNYAEDKVDLLRQVLHGDLEEAMAEALAVPTVGPAVEQLVAQAAAFLVRFAGRPQLYRTLLKESIFATGRRGDDLKAQVQRVAADVERRVAASGSQVDPSIAALHFVSAYYLALITSLAAEPPDPEGALGRLELQLRAVLEGNP